jgi:hypothetical protein
MDTLPIKQVHKSNSTHRSLNNLLRAVRAPGLLDNLPERPGRQDRHPQQLQYGRIGRVGLRGNALMRPPWWSFLSGQPGS